MTHTNRIEKYFDQTTKEPEKATEIGNKPPTMPVDASKFKEPTCEHCIHQREGLCHRFPQRYVVKANGVFLPYCGEFDDGYCEECHGH